MPPHPELSAYHRVRILTLTLLIAGSMVSDVALAAEWPNPTWRTATPASQSMDVVQLQKARDYALRGGGSGMVVRHGFLVYSWGSLATRYDLKSTTKSFGATALGLAVKDGRASLSGKAQSYFGAIGVPPDSNIATGWLDDITIMHLATHTAGFNKTGAESALLFRPGTKWGYSDGGPNWLADVLTTRYGRDLLSLMNARVFTVLQFRSTDLTWRSNAYRSDMLNGIKRREFGSGISASVDAMARLGLLYLRGGIWRDTRIISSSFVAQVRTVPAALAGLPITIPAEYPAATTHYGLLWWNNADGRMASVPRDAYWAWGLGDSLIVVIPSLDVVVARAGQPIRATPAMDPRSVEPFIGPIVASTRTVSTARSGEPPLLQSQATGNDMTVEAMLTNAPPVVSGGSDQTVVLPQDTIALAGSIDDDGRPGGTPLIEWKDISGLGAIFRSPADPTSLVTFPGPGIYVLELSANYGELTARDAVTVTVVDPAARPARMTTSAWASTLFRSAGATPVRATWLAFAPAVSSDGAVATLRVRIEKVLTPGRIEVHHVLGTWDTRSLGSDGPPPIDPVVVASYTVESDDAGLALETDVSDAVSSWTGEDAARGLVLLGVTGDVAIATDAAGAVAEIRLDQ